MNIRNAEIKDIDRINEIHNQAIQEKFRVAYVAPWTNNRMLEWFNDHSKRGFPVYVAEIGAVVAGYISIDSYRQGREALRQTVEISYFIDKNYRRMGIGKKLVEYMESQCGKLGIKTILAVIIDVNEASIKLIERCGYKNLGHLPHVAVFDGAEAGHLYYGKRIPGTR